MGVSNAFVCLLGLGTVFLGLICIILLCDVLSILCRRAASGTAPTLPAPAPGESCPAADPGQEIQAAISAALADFLGVDCSQIRIRTVAPPEPRWQPETAAAVAAAIAEDLNTDISGIRIVSKRQI